MFNLYIDALSAEFKLEDVKFKLSSAGLPRKKD